MNEMYSYKLSEVADIVTGSTPRTDSDHLWNGDFPFYSPTDFKGNIFCECTEKTVSQSGIQTGRLIPRGAIMVTCIGSIGKIAISSEDGITNQQINTLIVNPEFDVRYVYYVVLNNIDKLKQTAPQTTIPILNKTDFGKFSFDYHEYSTQLRVSRILSTIDRTIAKTEALIEKYQQIKAGLMHDLFTRGIGADGKLRSPREEAPELYQESAIGWIPKEWEVGLFGDNIEVIDPNPSHRYPSEVEDGYPICSTENFEGGDDFNFRKSKFVPETTYQAQNNKCRFKSTDVIFARKGKIGLARRYGQDKKVFSHTVVVMKPFSKSVDNNWLLWLSRSDWLLKGIDATMNTNLGVPTLGVEFIKNIAVPFPKDVEQKTMNKLLEFASNKVQSERVKKYKLEKQKFGLMHDLLTGKVSVNIDLDAS